MVNQQSDSNHKIADLLEWLAEECDVSFDRVATKRAVQEAQRGWPGSEQDRWWKWLIEAGDSLGLRVRVIEFSFRQALELVREKTLAVHIPGAEHPWLLIHKQHRQKFHIVTAGTGRAGRWVSQSQLADMIGNPPLDKPLTWVVVEPAVTCQPVDTEHAKTPGPIPSPLSRFWTILGAERSDIRIVLVFTLFVGVVALAVPLAVETLVSTVAFGRSFQPIAVLSIILFAFLTFSAVVQAVEKYVVELIQRRLFVRIAGDLSYRIPRVRRSALNGRYAPELMNRFFDVVTVQKVVAALLVDALDLIMVTVTGMIVLALFHPLLLALELILLALILFMLFVLGRGGIKSSIKESKVKYAMAAWLEGLARCTTTLKHEGGNEFAIERADYIAKNYLVARQAHFRILFRQIVFNLGLYAVSNAVILGAGGFLVINGQLSLGQLVAAELIVTIILGSVTKMLKHVEGFYDLMASVDKLGTLFDLPLERQDGLLSLPGDRGIELKLQDVSYGYRAGQTVLKNVNLTVESGATLGISGPPGCGKTTLAQLLFGLLHTTSGNIELDGIGSDNLRPDTLRRHVSLVGSIEIIEGTIAENVHLDRVKVDSTVVHESLRQVGLLEEIFLLPDGLDHQLTADGSPLSETSLRKLMLARSIAGAPRLLVIDTLLDALPDEEVQKLLPVLSGKDCPWTLIIFSGRSQILRHCDRVFNLKGNSSEQMPPESLNNEGV